MKKNYLLGILMGLAVTAGVLSGSAPVQAASGDVKINSTNFPDANFRKILQEKDYDANQDGILSVVEIDAIKDLDITGKNIDSLQGLEYLANLYNLYCADNNLSELDVSKNAELEVVCCAGNNLSELDVSRNVYLEHLSCEYNQITELDVSKNGSLRFLYCYNNNLSKLDVSKNMNLADLICSDNNLSKLDVSKNGRCLIQLYCSGNKLTKLDISRNPELRYLYCSENMLSTLDVSENGNLNELHCSSNRLICLKMGGNKMTEFQCNDNIRFISVNSSGQFDLSTLEGFNVKKAGKWKGGSVEGTILTVKSDEITYTYDTGGYDSENKKIKPVFKLVKCTHSGKTVKKTVKATFEKNGGVKTVCGDCGKTIKTHETYYKMEQPKLSKTSYTYNGEVKKPAVTVKDSKGNTLKKDTDYTVSYASGRKNPGKYKVTIKGKGKYSGTVTKTLTIKPPKSAITSISSPEKKMLKIGYKKSSVVTGYQVYCSASKDFSKDTYKFGRKKSDKNTLMISGLKSKKKYYVKIRTYKTVDDKRIYSSWSEVKSVKVK